MSDLVKRLRALEIVSAPGQPFTIQSVRPWFGRNARLRKESADRIEALEADLKATLQREDDANSAAFAHLRRMRELEAARDHALEWRDHDKDRAEKAEAALSEALRINSQQRKSIAGERKARKAAEAERDALRDVVQTVECLTATGEGLDPDETIRIHLLCGVGDNEPAEIPGKLSGALMATQADNARLRSVFCGLPEGDIKIEVEHVHGGWCGYVFFYPEHGPIVSAERPHFYARTEPKPTRDEAVSALPEAASRARAALSEGKT